ncbi:hypothetical protein FRC03_002410 [Tulasnella sp. 419]|nr:hypothetical protein FRC03_002410 [Tulasnella sp. 419]
MFSSTVVGLKVKTVKNFKSIEKVQDEVEAAQDWLSRRINVWVPNQNKRLMQAAI